MALLRWIPPEEGQNPVWWPLKPLHSDYSPQRTGLESPATLLLYGGGSGGGKSDWLVADAAQEVENPKFRGVLLRKSFREMNNIIDRMKAIYRPLGARSTEKDTMWRFPSGAQIRLGYMSSDADVENYQGTPFSWLGVDEAGNHQESRIRRMLPWLASTDPTLRVRARFTANPGGVGADWLMRLFLRDKCPIHYPEESVEGGAVYAGKRLTWSDGRALDETGKWTVSFIPALVGDNPLYGADKIAALRTQEAAIAEKLLAGCWCALAGRYFSFLTPSLQLPYAEHPGDWWNTYIIATDYGFGESWAAAGLFYVSEPTVDYPQGRMFQVAEYVGLDEDTGNKPSSEEFAQKIVDMWIDSGDSRRTISAVICDPATDGHTGNGRSNMEIMAEVFAERGIGVMGAHKDRVSNFQNLFRMLKKGQVVITDTCPATFKAINTRMHDPNRPGDIKKVKGSSLDDLTDMCVAEGTAVETERGPVPIEHVAIGDMVLTTVGLRRVLWSGMTGEDADTTRIATASGYSLDATATHPVWVEGRGFIRVDELAYGDKIRLCQDTLNTSSRSSIAELHFGVIPTPHHGTIDPTIRQASMIARLALKTFIARFTRTTTARFQKAMSSIIKTMTRSTMIQATTSWSLGASTPVVTALCGWPTPTNFMLLARRWIMPEHSQASGTNPSLERSGTASEPSAIGRTRRWQHLRALSARLLSPLTMLGITSSVHRSAQQRTAETRASTTCHESANFAASRGSSTDTPSRPAALDTVVSLSTGRKGRVYNLTVEGQPEFFANGILVHNCSYAANTFFGGESKPTDIRNSEKIKAMADAGMDEHSLGIHRLRMLMATDEDEAPVRISRVGQSRVISRG